MTVIFPVLLLSIAAEPYEAELRRAYVARATEAVRASDPKKLADAVSYLQTMDRNRCRSAFRRLRVQCLIEASARNCRSVPAADRERCALYSDIIVTSVLAEKLMISEAERHALAEKHRDYRAALQAELRTAYGGLAAAFRLSPHYSCDAADAACTAAAIDGYCLDQAEKRGLAWQHCVAGLVWFIATSSLSPPPQKEGE